MCAQNFKFVNTHACVSVHICVCAHIYMYIFTHTQDAARQHTRAYTYTQLHRADPESVSGNQTGVTRLVYVI